MTDTRHKDSNWTVCSRDATTVTFDGAQIAVLMDIRDELKETNRSLWRIRNILECSNVRRGFVAMRKLREHLAVVFPVAAPGRKRRKKPKPVVIRRRKPASK